MPSQPTTTSAFRWPPSPLAPSSTSRSTTRRLPFWAHFWRGTLLASAIALAALNVAAEFTVRSALRTPGLSAQERYARLIFAAKLYPFDRNIRTAAGRFATVFEDYVA